MATKADFTEDEWQAMQKGLTGAGMLVSTAHRDFTDSFGESAALAKELVAKRKDAATELLREISEVRGTGFGVFTSPTELERETLEALGTATDALSQKAPDELGPYRELVLEVAQTVAEAKGDVHEDETAAIETLRGALDGGGSTA